MLNVCIDIEKKQGQYELTRIVVAFLSAGRRLPSFFRRVIEYKTNVYIVRERNSSHVNVLSEERQTHFTRQ
jgi:hypothetical protein